MVDINWHTYYGFEKNGVNVFIDILLYYIVNMVYGRYLLTYLLWFIKNELMCLLTYYYIILLSIWFMVDIN